MNTVRRRRSRVDTGRSERVILADARELVVRPIEPADAGPIAASFHLLNEDEVRRRFLHILKALSEEHLRQLTHPVSERDYVVVAAEPLPPGEALVGAVARLSRDRDDDARAEFGILVSHFVMGLGLGRLLMERLVEWAGVNGVHELWGDVMDDNTAMLELAARLGFHRETIHGSPGLVRITLAITRSRR